MDSLRTRVFSAWRNRNTISPAPRYHVLPVSEDQELTSEKSGDGELPSQCNDVDSSTTSAEVEFKDYPTSWSFQLPTWSSFTSPGPPSDEPVKPPRRLHPTAWLDGLRGVASLMVAIHHSSWLWYPGLSNGWGISPDNRLFVQLPIIRIFYAAGSAMVAIFFIVSGFSLSYKSLGLIRAGRFPELLDSLSSSVFRRQLRLVLPPAATTFVSMLVTHAGWYGTGPNSREPPHYDSLEDNVLLWLRSVVELGDPFRPVVYPGGYNPPFDTNLWTIPVELHGSMVIFVTLLGLSKLHSLVRLAVLVSIVLYLLYYAYTHLFLFLSGVLLAELNYMREERTNKHRAVASQEPGLADLEPPTTPESEQERQWAIGIKIFWTLNFLLALFVCCMPLVHHGAGQSPGYMTLASMIPAHYRAPFVEDHFWIFIAAFHLVFTIDNAKFLQPIFTNRFSLYLGKISFALYIIHGSFLYTLGWNLSARTLDWTGRDPGFQYASGLILTALVLYPLLFWAADIVARHVDARSVRFARWLWLKAFIAS
jgi:peptidoglycan/LPS O-acetylase OafA/YrhL